LFCEEEELNFNLKIRMEALDSKRGKDLC
jgi:hypothetical protein